MQVKETLNKGLKRGYSFIMPGAELAELADEKLREIQPKYTLNGFRPGKVPLAELRKRVGRQASLEVINGKMDEAVQEHFRESGDRPARQPKLDFASEETLGDGSDCELKLAYEKLPEVPEISLTGLKVEKLVVKVDAAKVDEACAEMVKESSVFETKKADKPSAKGDQVLMDFACEVNGEEIEGSPFESFSLVLGSGMFLEEFHTSLEGKKPGEEAEFEARLDSRFAGGKYDGQKAKFTCKVSVVREPKPAKLDDDFAKGRGSDSLEDLKRKVREGMEKELEGISRQILKKTLFDALEEMVKFELPECLIEEEAAQIAQQLEQEKGASGGGESGEPEVTKEHRELAKRRVKLGLLLADVGNKRSVKISEASLMEALGEYAAGMGIPPAREADFFKDNAFLVDMIKAQLYEERVVDHMLNVAEIKDKTVGEKELRKRFDDLESADMSDSTIGITASTTDYSGAEGGMGVAANDSIPPGPESGGKAAGEGADAAPAKDDEGQGGKEAKAEAKPEAKAEPEKSGGEKRAGGKDPGAKSEPEAKKPPKAKPAKDTKAT